MSYKLANLWVKNGNNFIPLLLVRCIPDAVVAKEKQLLDSENQNIE